MTIFDENLPQSLFSTEPFIAIECELSHQVYSWEAGLRPVRTRICSFTQVQADVMHELQHRLSKRASEVRIAANRVSILAEEVEMLRICLDNSSNIAHTTMRPHTEKLFKHILLRRRCSRLARCIGILEELSGLHHAIVSMSHRDAVEQLREIRAIINRLPQDLHLLKPVQRKLQCIIRGYRATVLEQLALIASSSSSVCVKAELLRVFGDLSIISDEATFWYLSDDNSEELETLFLKSVFEKGVFQQLVHGETFERLMEHRSDCRTRSSGRFDDMIHRLHAARELVTVIDHSSWLRLETRLRECYALYIFFSTGQSDVSLLLSPESMNRDAYWPRRKRLRNLQAIVVTNQYIHSINRCRPRNSLSLSAICIAVESVTHDETLYRELSWSVYESLVTTTLGHAISNWSLDDHSHLCGEIQSFLSALKCTGGGVVPESTLIAIYPILEEVVVEAFLRRIPTLAEDNDDALEYIAENVRIIQQELSSLFKLNQSKWSVVYECLQVISLRSAEFTYEWARDRLSCVPIDILIALIRVSERNRSEFTEKLESDLLSFIPTK